MMNKPLSDTYKGPQVGVSTTGICMKILKQLEHITSSHISADLVVHCLSD